MFSTANSLTSLRGSERGRRAFVVGNSPSVRNEPLELLKGELSISMNAGVLLAEEFGFTSKYYALSDRRFLLNSFKRPMATSRLPSGTIRFLRSDVSDVDEQDERHITHYVRPLARDGFSTDLRQGFFHGSTTALLAMQIAVFLGVSEIVMLGVDLHYPEDQPRFYREKEREEEDIMLSVQIKNIADAARTCESLGITVLCCSEKSLLRPYLDYLRFIDAINTKKKVVVPRTSVRSLVSSLAPLPVGKQARPNLERSA
jgi:hypothetical protein